MKFKHFFVGFFIGMCMKCFKSCEEYEWPDAAIKWLKFTAMLFVAVVTPIVTHFI